MYAMFRFAALPFAFFSVMAFAADNSFTGIWRLNCAKSIGSIPATCFQNDTLTIPSELFTGSAAPDWVGKLSRTAKQEINRCNANGPFRFTQSPNRQMLILEQPQTDPHRKAVFEKQ